MSKKRDLTEGSITSAIFSLSWPVVTTNLFQSLYNIADTFWLGRLGVLEIGAPTLSWPVVNFIVSFSGGFSMAGTSFVAQHHGAGEEDMVGEAIGQTILISMFISVFLGILGFFLTDDIVRWMGASEELFPFAAVFMKTIFLATPFTYGFNVYSSLLRGYGDTVTPMRLSIYSVILNVVLDPLLIFGLGVFPSLGVFGAALATLISRGIFTVYAFYLLISGKNGIKLKPSNFIPKPDRIFQIIKMGLPLGFSQSVQAIGLIVVMAIITSFGNFTLAAYGIGTRYNSLAIMVAMGISMASAAIVGQNLGAGKTKRAEQTVVATIALNTVIMVGISIFFVLFRYPLIGLFTGDRQVIKIGANFLLIVPFFLPFFAIMQSFIAAFNGSGHTLSSMWMMLSRLWTMRIPLVYLLGWTLMLGYSGVWWAIGLSNLGGAVLAFLLFIPGRWKVPKARFKVAKNA